MTPTDIRSAGAPRRTCRASRIRVDVRQLRPRQVSDRGALHGTDQDRRSRRRDQPVRRRDCGNYVGRAEIDSQPGRSGTLSGRPATRQCWRSIQRSTMPSPRTSDAQPTAMPSSPLCLSARQLIPQEESRRSLLGEDLAQLGLLLLGQVAGNQLSMCVFEGVLYAIDNGIRAQQK